MNYIKEIVFASIVCGILARLAPTAKNGNGKYVKFVASLAFLCMLLSPFGGELRNIPESLERITDFSDSDETTEPQENGFRGSLELVSAEICKAAANAAAERFSVASDNFNIRLIIDKSDSGEFSIREATIYASGEAAKLSNDSLGVYFKEILGCSVEVVK